MSSPTPLPAAVRLLLLLVAYGGAAIWLTWPLASDVFGTLPCTSEVCFFDTRYSAWVLAWESRALVTPSASVADTNIFYPAKDTLYYGPAGFGALPYYAPTFLASGSAALATNVMLLLNGALAALALHWVVWRWTGLESAGLVAAATLLMHTWYFWGFIAATPHLSPLQYFPLIVWLAAARDLSWRRAAVLGVAIVAQCLTDPVYVAPAVIAPLALLAAWRGARAGSRRDGLVLAVVLVMALLCLGPFTLGYLRVRAENFDLTEQTLWRGRELPTHLAAVLWSRPTPTTIASAALSLLALGGGLALWRRVHTGRRLAHDGGWQHGLLWLLVGTWISLPPAILVGGHLIHTPQSLLAKTTPLYDLVREPGRLGVAALIGACILSGIAFAEVVRSLEHAPAARRAGPALRAVLAAAVVAALYWRPPGPDPIPETYPVQQLPKPPPAFLAELAHDNGPIVALPSLPAGSAWTGSQSLLSSDHWVKSVKRNANATRNASAMYLSTFHWRPLLNGYSSYWPDGFVERMELAEQLPARAALQQLVRQTGVRHVWVDLEACLSRERRRWEAANRGLVPGLELRARDEDQLLFAIDPERLADAP